MRPKEQAADRSTEWVNLHEFSALVGHPVELIRKELFLGEAESPEEKIQLKDLRQAMASLLDRTFSDNNL